MDSKILNRKIVIVNQAANYLTVDICNAFVKKTGQVHLITGNVHEQGNLLDKSIRISKINRYRRSSSARKILSYLTATIRIWMLLITKYRKFEVLFIALPPMAYLLTILVKNKCSMLIWDVYPDAFKVTGMSEKNKIYKLWAQANQRVFKRAYRLFTIGNRMKELLSVYILPEKISVIPLWSIFDGTEKINKNSNPFIKQEELQDKFVVQYSGNIGLTHNVELVIELAELLKENNSILFQIIGKGLRVPYLKQLAKEKNLTNCQFLPFQTDEMFPLSLSAASLGIVILDDRTSKGSIPSKTYNLMSFGIPIIYLVSEDSELHDYCFEYNNGKSFNRLALNVAAEFIQQLASDDYLYQKLSVNSALAAKNFTRRNADQIVEKYFS